MPEEAPRPPGRPVPEGATRPPGRPVPEEATRPPGRPVPEGAAPAAATRRLPRYWRLIVLAATGVLVLLVLGGGSLLQAWSASRGADAGQAVLARLAAEHVIVADAELQARLLPVIDRPDLSIAFTDLPVEDRAAARGVLGSALAVYPAGFVHRLIDRIVLAGNIKFWSGEEVGGFFFARGIAVNCRGMEAAYIVRDVHHELSSLVRERATPAEAAWMAANPAGFAYLSVEASRAMMREGRSDEDGPALYERGFVRAYGTTSLDNDYNTYAERMFTDGTGFAATIRPYARMRAKTRLVIASYLAVDAGLAGYFETSGLRAAAAE